MMVLDTTAATHFDRTSELQPLTSDTRAPSFAVELPDEWSSLHGVHGGYLASLAVRAVQSVAPTRAVRTATTTFLRPASVGPARFDVDVLRNGRSFTTVEVRVVQAERLVATTRTTLLEPGQGPRWSQPIAGRPAPLGRSVPFTPPPGIRHFEHADLRLDPATIPDATAVGRGEIADIPRIAGHVRPLEGRPIDAPWLVMIGDWFPPSPFRRLAPPAGGVSIDYTIHIHRLPEPCDRAIRDDERWLEGVFISAQSSGMIALERGVLSGPDGVPIAETFHTRYTGG
jgi:acyl-CoA thioesterase